VNEPNWLTEQIVLAIHEGLISQYGGLFLLVKLVKYYRQFPHVFG
jgi:hypothetical protein